MIFGLQFSFNVFCPCEQQKSGNFVQVKWQFPFHPAGMGKFENLSRSPACFRKFPVDPHVLFAFQPVKPKLLESALVHTVMSVIRDSLVLAF